MVGIWVGWSCVPVCRYHCCLSLIYCSGLRSVCVDDILRPMSMLTSCVMFESNIVHIRNMTLGLLFFRRCILGKTIRLQYLVGNPGRFQPTLEHVKAGLREAMSEVEHDWFLLAFNKGDKWCAPHKKNHEMHMGNKDRLTVKMTADQLDELDES